MNKDEGAGITYRVWAASSPRAVLLLVHGLGAHSGRWEPLADFFLKNSISSYSIELEGFGETVGLKGHIDSFDTYIEGVLSLNGIIRKENEGKKVFLLGESMGALVSILTAARARELFDGLICISPAFKSSLKFALSDYLKIFLSLIFNPKRQFEVSFNSSMCTQDEAYLQKMDNDPKEHRLATAKLLWNIALAQIKACGLKSIGLPVLFLIAGKEDRIADAKASKKVFNGLKAGDKEIIQYPDMLHALSIEKDRGLVFRDILRWIERHL